MTAAGINNVMEKYTKFGSDIRRFSMLQAMSRIEMNCISLISKKMFDRINDYFLHTFPCLTKR